MSRPVVIFTRPECWDSYKSDELDLINMPLAGGAPVELRNGNLCGDSVGGVITEVGAAGLVRAFEEHRPDIFLFWATYAQDGTKKRVDGVVSILRKLRALAPKAKFVYGNGNQQGIPDFNVAAFRQFVDCILINTRDQREVKMYHEYGIRHVHTLSDGFDSAKHGPGLAYSIGKVPKYDCFFGGSQTLDLRTGKPSKFYPRNKMLSGKYIGSRRRFEFLKTVNEKFKLLVRGKGKWTPIVNQKYLSGEAYFPVFGDARIVLGMHHWDLERYYTKRTVYSGASGRLHLTYYIPGMEKDFENGKNIAWFKTLEEGIEKIRYYLNHESERDRVAAEQRNHFVRYHSWEARLREFEKIAKEILQ